MSPLALLPLLPACYCCLPAAVAANKGACRPALCSRRQTRLPRAGARSALAALHRDAALPAHKAHCYTPPATRPPSLTLPPCPARPPARPSLVSQLSAAQRVGSYAQKLLLNRGTALPAGRCPTPPCTQTSSSCCAPPAGLRAELLCACRSAGLKAELLCACRSCNIAEQRREPYWSASRRQGQRGGGRGEQPRGFAERRAVQGTAGSTGTRMACCLPH